MTDRIKQFSNKRKRRPKKITSSIALISSQKKPPAKPFDLKRLIMVWGVLVIGIILLTGRLYQLQIGQGAELALKARQQQTTSLRPYIPRRTVIDSQNNVLATDRLVYTLYVHPKLFKEPKEIIANKLGEILEKSPQELIAEFNTQETGIKIAENLSEAISKKIRQLSYDGVDLNQYYSRYYPQNEMASEVIGYLDKQRQPQAGIENSQEKLLTRQLSNSYIRRTGNGMLMPAEVPQGLVQLDDLQLQLTLDLRLQRIARAALQEKMNKFNAKRGVVMIMDVHDGAILALACEPTYNPNEYFEYNVKLFKNWAVSDLYEPGSTFKSINIALALDAGVIKPNSYVYDSGRTKIDGWTIGNYDYSSKGARGFISITEVLQNSSNMGMIEIMKRIKPKDYYQKLKDLGLGERIGVDLPGEARGHLKSEIEFITKPIEPATAAFGQGISLTPLKLLQLNAAIANGGLLVTPHVIKGLVDSENNYHWQKTFTNKRVFSSESTRAVLKMMEAVVNKGSGKAAQIEGYRIAGKTGTSQKAGPTGGYIQGAKITSFVSILPVEAPRYVVLAVVDEPKGSQALGGTVAAPITKSVMEALIAIKGIPPSKDTQSN